MRKQGTKKERRAEKEKMKNNRGREREKGQQA
jgi:hypothetical protein